jgi:hypothetical protein
MSPADRLAALRALGLEISAIEGGRWLEVVGPANIIDAARPVLVCHRLALLAYLSNPALAELPDEAVE